MLLGISIKSSPRSPGAKSFLNPKSQATLFQDVSNAFAPIRINPEDSTRQSWTSQGNLVASDSRLALRGHLHCFSSLSRKGRQREVLQCLESRLLLASNSSLIFVQQHLRLFLQLHLFPEVATTNRSQPVLVHFTNKHYTNLTVHQSPRRRKSMEENVGVWMQCCLLASGGQCTVHLRPSTCPSMVLEGGATLHTTAFLLSYSRSLFPPDHCKKDWLCYFRAFLIIGCECSQPQTNALPPPQDLLFLPPHTHCLPSFPTGLSSLLWQQSKANKPFLCYAGRDPLRAH